MQNDMKLIVREVELYHVCVLDKSEFLSEQILSKL